MQEDDKCLFFGIVIYMIQFTTIQDSAEIIPWDAAVV